MASVARELFFNKYWMNVEERAFYTDEWLDNVGMMGVNSMEEAEVIMSRFRQVRVTIPILADYYAKNYRLEFINTDDITEMFDLINTHLSNWTELTNQMGYISDIPPIEDFEMLDKLAEVLYPYRKVNQSVIDVLSIFNGPIRAGTMLEYTQGIYQPYSHKLFKYCEQARLQCTH